MEKAWLVRWGCYGHDENKCLKQSGIDKKIIDIISLRKDWEQITKIAKDIYRCKMLSFSEKIYLSDWSKGVKRQKDFFGGTVPIFTHYHSSIYQKIAKNTQKGINKLETKKLLNKWTKSPEYITIGYNPYLEIRKVFNLVVHQDDNGNEILEWDELNAGGNLKKEKYKCS